MAKKKQLPALKDKPTREGLISEIALMPSTTAASTITRIGSMAVGELDFITLSKELDHQIDALKNGDLSRPESLLLSQAHTLDALFNNLCAHSITNMGKYLSTMETYMRLAFKAQNQCQATLRTLGEIKSPKSVAFVKQANIAQNQQVNNGKPEVMDMPHAEKSKIQQNELLEDNYGQRVDNRAKKETSRADTELETVGAINRPKE